MNTRIKILIPHLKGEKIPVTVLHWHKRIGELVQPGDVVADLLGPGQIRMEAEAGVSGILINRLLSAGDRGFSDEPLGILDCAGAELPMPRGTVPEHREPSSVASPSDRQSPGNPSFQRGNIQATQRKYEELVKKRSRREPGLLSAYFQEHPRIDAQLVPIDELVNRVISLYSIPLLELLWREDNWYNVFEEDIEICLRGRNMGRLRDHVWNQVEIYRDLIEGKMPTTNEKRTDDRLLEGRSQRETARSWNDVLDVDVGASFDEIQAAYRKKISQYHPDRVAGLGPELQDLAEKHSIEIIAAYAEARKMHGRT